MKNYLLVLAATIAFSSSVWSQADASAVVQPAVAKVDAESAAAAKSKDAPIVREKFDPKRDPAADLAAAVAMTAKNGKRIVIDLGGEWCVWCVFMDKFFIQNPELAKFRDDNFVWVKVNYSEENKNEAFLADYPAAAGYPHLYMLDDKGKFLFSEDTSALEKGRGYDLEKVTDFLKTWAPPPAKAAK